MSNEYNLARLIAEKFHAGQLYGDRPYTDHLWQVTSSVEEGTTDERSAIVAILHDILEDTACTIALLASLFDDDVVDAVFAITRQAGESKEDYLKKVKANALARQVKIHDSFCNLRESIMRNDVRRIKKYTDQINYLVSE